MRVHPTPRRRSMAFGPWQKKLRRLPHIFSKVLELPLGADADVYVEESPAGFRFVASASGVSGVIRAHSVEIHPGLMKVVVRGDGGFEEEELENDRWRFRLPPSTRPALATAECFAGEIIVLVPKGAAPDEAERFLT